jgi:hypothetical protein
MSYANNEHRECYKEHQSPQAETTKFCCFGDCRFSAVFTHYDIMSEVLKFWSRGQLILFGLINKTSSGVVRRYKSAYYSNVKEYCSSPELLEWAINMGCPTEELWTHCAGLGYLDTITWLRDNQHIILPPWNVRSCIAAAREGHIEVLQVMQHLKPPRKWRCVCTATAGSGHLSVLKWLRQQSPPYPWSVNTCTAAASGGHLDVLMWLREQNPPCPWDKDTSACAFKHGHFHVVKWLVSQVPACPCHPRLLEYIESGL